MASTIPSGPYAVAEKPGATAATAWRWQEFTTGEAESSLSRRLGWSLRPCIVERLPPP